MPGTLAKLFTPRRNAFCYTHIVVQRWTVRPFLWGVALTTTCEQKDCYMAPWDIPKKIMEKEYMAPFKQTKKIRVQLSWPKMLFPSRLTVVSGRGIDPAEVSLFTSCEPMWGEMGVDNISKLYSFLGYLGEQLPSTLEDCQIGNLDFSYFNIWNHLNCGVF